VGENMPDADCVLLSQFDTFALGADAPTDIAYNPDTDQYAILDSTDDQVYIVSTSGVLQWQFDTANFSASTAQGLTCNPEKRLFGVIDSTVDTLFFVDVRGILVSQFDTALIEAGVLNPTGITVLSANRLARVDPILKAIFVTDKSGGFIRNCSTSSFGANSPQGILLAFPILNVSEYPSAFPARTP
jgi:hypothetical protein